MKFVFLATALAAAVATVPAPPSVPPAPESPAELPELETTIVLRGPDTPTVLRAPKPASAITPAAAATAASPATDSATDRELARLARLAADDAARQSREPSIRNAPGRESIESSGLRRCLDAAGASVFTDRACTSIDAIDAPQVVSPTRAGARQIAVRSCARNKEDLLNGVRSALEVHDVNRLADYYHWSGMDGAEGYRLMDRLDAFSKRPFVDARLVSSRAPPVVDSDLGSAGLLSRATDSLAADPRLVDQGLVDPGTADPPAPRALPARAADLLRVDQMRSDRDAAAEVTWFRLRPNAGCWWMQY